MIGLHIYQHGPESEENSIVAAVKLNLLYRQFSATAVSTGSYA
ncbi:hypothetical protein ACZ87_01428 [Candidatus Erwinia dacicola]|uniref:Uncharacterized protein n=1 Tax=Candidatus Erwinia dacicola TaxID=252393 RepID=A0A328TMH1_9GAMM|nr:hypothetical protein ACZ87_01428 [Candidatus Erwinia dacicola]